ncbi:MAG TPA: Uma2 family endonuclease, partial [Gemmataceae bacterium]|nr:Uma2 family endonuclease [Gemmataceae bacterium]
MPLLITDPELVKETRARREASDGDKWNEVWDGVLVMPTLPNDEHQEIQGRLLFPLTMLFEMTGTGKVRPGVNVTDRHPDWTQNFRGPDLVVYLPGNPAVNHGTHWVGGPDFLVEIMSPGDLARDKLAFYAKVNTREVLIVDRDPWAMELYQLGAGMLRLAGRSDPSNPAVLTSGVLPLTF